MDRNANTGMDNGAGRELAWTADASAVYLYTPQARPVIDAIERDGVCFSKPEYVRRKYEESAPIFLFAYSWYEKAAEVFVKKPSGAEFPYWAFGDPKRTDGSAGGTLLRLCVPKEEAVFFDAADWNKILRLSYIGENEAEEKRFSEELSARGINTNQMMLSPYYPEWRKKVVDSWKRLFRRHEAILSGNTEGVSGGVQAGLWCIRREWILEDGAADAFR